MEAAITLVEFEADGQSLKVSDEALEKIQNVPTTFGIKTVAIVGPGRIGKSSLLNWLVGKDVFEIGSKTERVTKGIWMYIDENEDEQLANVYLDVEGFGNPSKSNAAENDDRLLNVVIQICDVVLYNIRGVHDNVMRDKIKFVCSLFHRYRKGNVVLENPILVSVVRDFELEADDNPDIEFKNMFTEDHELLDTFRETKAFRLVKPKQCKPAELAMTTYTDLCEEFREEMNKIKIYLMENTKPLYVAEHKAITGDVLAENIRRTVTHVNDDDLSMLSRSLPQILDGNNDAIKKSAIETYKFEMTQKWPLPSHPETLTELHEAEKNVALEHIDEKCFTIPGIVEVDEQPFMDELENTFKDMQKDKCKEALKSATCEIEVNLREDVYFEDDGPERFLHDYDKAEKTFAEYRNLGPEKMDLWQTFKERIDTTEMIIKKTSNFIEIAKKAANSEKEIKEINTNLERELKEIKDTVKEYRKNHNYSTIFSLGKFLICLATGTSEIHRNLAVANQSSAQNFGRHMLPSSGASRELLPQGGSLTAQTVSLAGLILGRLLVDMVSKSPN